MCCTPKLHGYITYVVIEINKISVGFSKRHGLKCAFNAVDQ